MTDPGRKCQKTDGGGRAFNQIAQSQIDIDTYEHEVVGEAINYSALPAFPVSQARELTIRIVERVGANKQRHADNIRAQITIVEKMSTDNPD